MIFHAALGPAGRKRLRGFFELLAGGRSLAKNVGLMEVARKLALYMELGRV
jgi:hypothetical protein